MIDLKKLTRINRLNLDETRRLVFISDIHGDIDSLKEAIKRINFNKNDYLFILGDMYEKGDEGKNLLTLRYIMDLKKNNDNVYLLAGNCDEVFRFILSGAKENFLNYVVVKQKSIINDLANEMNYPLSMDMDVKDFVNKLYEKYEDLFIFMDNLDDVIFINDKLVLVHGGIDDINNIPTYALPLLKYDKFYELSKPQPKLMMVGHYPTRNYRSDIACVNPIFDFSKRIISIDGGNHIVKGGQLNVVYLESLESMRFRYFYVDHYPKYIMKDNVKYEKDEYDINIVFGDNEVEILDTDLDFYFIRQNSSKMCMWVHKSFVYKDNNKYYCYDACNQFISVNKGDEISVIKKAKPYSLIKKNGYIGLIDTKYIKDEV